MAFVEVENLVKYYPSSDTTAVDNISFEIQQGEIFSLLSPNGARKTTTISILSTLIRSINGSASVDGKGFLEEKMAVRKTIGAFPGNLPV